MDDKFTEKLAALVTIAAALYFVLEKLGKGEACCASCADKKPRGWGGGRGSTACSRSMFGSPPPRNLPVSTSDEEEPSPS